VSALRPSAPPLELTCTEENRCRYSAFRSENVLISPVISALATSHSKHEARSGWAQPRAPPPLRRASLTSARAGTRTTVSGLKRAGHAMPDIHLSLPRLHLPRHSPSSMANESASPPHEDTFGACRRCESAYRLRSESESNADPLTSSPGWCASTLGEERGVAICWSDQHLQPGRFRSKWHAPCIRALADIGGLNPILDPSNPIAISPPSEASSRPGHQWAPDSMARIFSTSI